MQPQYFPQLPSSRRPIPFKLHSKLRLALQSIQTPYIRVASLQKHSKILYQANHTGFFYLDLTKTKCTKLLSSHWKCLEMCSLFVYFQTTTHLLLSYPSMVDILALRGPKATSHASPFILYVEQQRMYINTCTYTCLIASVLKYLHIHSVYGTYIQTVCFQGYVYRQYICKTFHNYWEQPTFSLTEKESS